MKVSIVGGGPAGLYLAALLKSRAPKTEIQVIERNQPDDTFGWGVVFSDETLGHFGEADPESFAAIERAFVRWDSIDTHFRGQVIRSTGHGFVGIARRKLLNLLQSRCAELGVKLEFGREVEELAALADSDVIVAADGINSKLRDSLAHRFRPSVVEGKSRYIWLGTHRLFEAFTFILRENEHGFFTVHAYSFDAETSTFIVETDEESFQRAGLEGKSEEQTIAYCEQLFAPELNGAALLSNRSRWLKFRRMTNETWFADNVVLIGDAAHTAHFSIGSGTKLAMEDSIALAEALLGHASVPEALAAYQEARWVDVAKLQKAATTSREWFEEVRRYRDLDPLQLTFSMLSRSKRITHDNLRVRDPALVVRIDRFVAAQAGWNGVGVPAPPMFQPFSLRGLTLPNRVVVSPMCQYSAVDGLPNDWHLVHLGSRALGGAGLVMTEMTDVCATGRISPGCTGLYTDAHEAAWKRIVDFVHQRTPAKIGIQLGHAGRKGATHVPWENDGRPLQLAPGEWPLVAASAIPFQADGPVPRAMDRQDMDRVRADFVAATQRAARCGFDLLELHFAHGYLLATFISPITNQRADEYGGSVENRMRFPLEVLEAARAAWPAERPLAVRISACDWLEGGLSEADLVTAARLLKQHGCDLIDVSTGQTAPGAEPLYGRMYQTPFADRIRHEVGIPVIAVGAIQNWDHVNTVIAAGRADLCALARPHLYDPYFTLHAAADQEHELSWPVQYERGSTRPPLARR